MLAVLPVLAQAADPAAVPDPLAWHAHWDVYAACLGLLTAYFWALRTLGPKLVGHPEVPIATRRQKASFVAAIAVLFLVSASPLHDIGERFLFSAHMTQHMLQAFVVAPLLLLGTPRWMFLKATARVRPLVRFVAQPLVAAVLFNVTLVLLHWPAMVDTMLTDRAAHFGLHYLWIVTAIIMWLPVHSPAPEVTGRLSRPVAMAYLFLMTFIPTVPASFLTFGETLVYPRYGTFPEIWGIDALQDQRTSGLIMKTGVGFLLWGIITAMFFRWARAEERRSAPLRELRANDLPPSTSTTSTTTTTTSRGDDA